MKRSGAADMRLSGGRIPPWLYSRMKKLALPIVESILQCYGHKHFLSKLSDPFWFQSFGAVIGMDWNTSGVTTAVMSAMKDSLNPHSSSLGLYVCGGKGKESLKTPEELLKIGDTTGLDGNLLARSSKLTAKIDNTAVQDGYNLYLHSFVLSAQGDWSVIQQGMHGQSGMARRYHWHSNNIQSFVSDPHAAVCGDNHGSILNLVAKEANDSQTGILELTNEKPDLLLREIPHMKLPVYDDVKSSDVDLKRLGSVLWLAQELEHRNFEELLLLKVLGPRTLQSLTLVSEVIHGTPSRFTDPARFSFAHGGKTGTPFPVPTRIYDETIAALTDSVEKARIGFNDKNASIKSLHKIAARMEENFKPRDSLEQLKEQENRNSVEYGGRVASRKKPKNNDQLNLFD